ncbi:site-specific integrase [Streptomyces sp. NPDC007861]|uniref:site-specific integrase n=1 Tax=Streptomyces sp. NPDC007861 TaxID=3154893 RepID=UPI0033F1BB05
MFGLSAEDIDYERGMLHVRRQVQAIHGRLYFALPKGKKIRTVDLPPLGSRGTEAFTCTWKPALAKAGVIPPRAEGAKAWQWAAAAKDGFHVLRHTYASIMLEAGESVVTLARWLGHSSPAITLGYYAHFMPEAGSKGRGTIDGLLGERGDRCASRNSPDSPQHH